MSARRKPPKHKQIFTLERVVAYSAILGVVISSILQYLAWIESHQAWRTMLELENSKNPVTLRVVSAEMGMIESLPNPIVMVEIKNCGNTTVNVTHVSCRMEERGPDLAASEIQTNDRIYAQQSVQFFPISVSTLEKALGRKNIFPIRRITITSNGQTILPNEPSHANLWVNIRIETVFKEEQDISLAFKLPINGSSEAALLGRVW